MGNDMSTIIAGVGSYLPEQVITSEELELRAGYERFGLKVGMCEMLSGCKTRHFAAPDEACSDLATKAGAEALDRAGIQPSNVDVVIFGSVTQDFAEPATANVIADNLGIRNGYVFDVKNACNAFMQGIDIADSLIKTDKADTVLVVSGEVFSRWIKLEYDDREELKRAAPVVLSLGDGAGAFVLTRSSDSQRGIQASLFRTQPELWNNNVMWGGGVIYPRDPEKMYIPGTTQAIIAQTDAVSGVMVQGLLDKCGWTLDEVDYILPTQGATWLVKHIAKLISYDEEHIYNIVDHIGNVGASNVPIATCEALDRGIVGKGSKVVFLSGAVGMSTSAIAFVL